MGARVPVDEASLSCGTPARRVHAPWVPPCPLRRYAQPECPAPATCWYQEPKTGAFRFTPAGILVPPTANVSPGLPSRGPPIEPCGRCPERSLSGLSPADREHGMAV